MTYPQPGGGQPHYPGYPPSAQGYPPGQPAPGAGYPTSGAPGYPPPHGPVYPHPGQQSAPGQPISGSVPGYGIPGQQMTPGPPGYGVPGVQPSYGVPGQQPPGPSYGPSYGGPGPLGHPRIRPTVVTAAAMFMLAIPVLQVVSFAVTLVGMNTITDNVNEFYADLGLSGDWDGTPPLTGVGVVTLLMSLTIGVLSLFNLKGSNGSRVVTWVLLGLGVLGGLTGLVMLLTLQASIDSLDTSLSYSSAYRSSSTTFDIIPGWFLPTTALLSAVLVTVEIIVIVLLARPAANLFFNRRLQGYA